MNLYYLPSQIHSFSNFSNPLNGILIHIFAKESQLCHFPYLIWFGLPQWLSGKELTCNARDAGDTGSIPGSGRSPGGGRGNLLQYSCLENPMDVGAWRATVHRIAESRTWMKRLRTHVSDLPFYQKHHKYFE